MGIYSTQPVQAAPAPNSAPQPIMSAPVTPTSSGDIYLGPKPQKSKRPLIIGIAVAVIVIIIIIASTLIWAVSQNGGGSGSNTAEQSNLSQFVNYIIYGETAGDNNPAYENTAVGKAVSERNIKYFVTASSLIENSTDPAAVQMQVSLNFLRAYVETDMLDMNTMFIYYAANGREATEAKINEELQNLQTANSITFNPGTVAESAETYLTATFSLAQAIDAAGCFKSGKPNKTCIEKMALPVELQEKSASATAALSSATKAANEILSSLVDMAYGMKGAR